MRGPFFFYYEWGVSGCRSPERLRTWGSYLLACLLLPCAILHCFSSAFRSILDIWLFWVKLKISAWSPPPILLKPVTQGLCLYTLFLPLLQFYLSSRLPSVPTFPPSPPSRPSLPPVRPRQPPPCDSRWSLSLAGLLLLLLRSWPCLQGFRVLLWLRPCWPPSAEVWLESRSRPASLPDVDGSSWALLGWRSVDPRTDPELCVERSRERCMKWSAERSGSAGRRSPSATKT